MGNYNELDCEQCNSDDLDGSDKSTLDEDELYSLEDEDVLRAIEDVML